MEVVMLKRFNWKENEVYSIQLKSDLYILAQLLIKPYVAFFNIKSNVDNFNNSAIDLNEIEPLGVCMVLKDFFKICAACKLVNNIISKKNIPIPELFISMDREQWFHKSKLQDDDFVYNLVRIDPTIGDKGIMGNEIVEYNINKKDNNILNKYEIVGHNTGYELIRRLILSVQNNHWIDPLKEKLSLGVDSYPLKTVEEMWREGVPKYRDNPQSTDGAGK
jgi:hypothetical protein